MLLCQSYVFIGLLSKWQLRQAVLVQCLIFPMWAAWHDTGSGPMWFDSKHAAQPTLPGGVEAGGPLHELQGWVMEPSAASNVRRELCPRAFTSSPLHEGAEDVLYLWSPASFAVGCTLLRPAELFEKRSSPLNQRCSPSDVRSVRRRL